MASAHDVASPPGAGAFAKTAGLPNRWAWRSTIP